MYSSLPLPTESLRTGGVMVEGNEAATGLDVVAVGVEVGAYFQVIDPELS